MAKLSRESRLRERRLEKAAKKEARKRASAHPPHPAEATLTGNADEPVRADAAQPDVQPVVLLLPEV